MARVNRALLLAVMFAAWWVFPVRAQEVPPQYKEVLNTLGKKGDYRQNVLKVNIPRNDLKVTVDGVETPTPFGFGGWLGMTKGSGGQEVMMGDLVLLEEEVNPVMSALLDNGLEVTALHNHFFFEEPRIFFMHVMGHGSASDLAKRVKPAVDLIGRTKPAEQAPRRQITIRPGTINTARIAQIVGHEGEQNGAVYKITVGRDDLKVQHMGATINSRMGLNTWAAFVGNDQNAAIAGDVAMLPGEVNRVLKTLRANGINVVAIHNHMINTNPEIIFLHYWGKGPAEKLAAGFKAALQDLGKRGGPAPSPQPHR